MDFLQQMPPTLGMSLFTPSTPMPLAPQSSPSQITQFLLTCPQSMRFELQRSMWARKTFNPPAHDLVGHDRAKALYDIDLYAQFLCIDLDTDKAMLAVVRELVKLLAFDVQTGGDGAPAEEGRCVTHTSFENAPAETLEQYFEDLKYDTYARWVEFGEKQDDCDRYKDWLASLGYGTDEIRRLAPLDFEDSDERVLEELNRIPTSSVEEGVLPCDQKDNRLDAVRDILPKMATLVSGGESLPELEKKHGVSYPERMLSPPDNAHEPNRSVPTTPEREGINRSSKDDASSTSMTRNDPFTMLRMDGKALAKRSIPVAMGAEDGHVQDHRPEGTDTRFTDPPQRTRVDLLSGEAISLQRQPKQDGQVRGRRRLRTPQGLQGRVPPEGPVNLRTRSDSRAVTPSADDSPTVHAMPHPSRSCLSEAHPSTTNAGTAPSPSLLVAPQTSTSSFESQPVSQALGTASSTSVRFIEVRPRAESSKSQSEMEVPAILPFSSPLSDFLPADLPTRRAVQSPAANLDATAAPQPDGNAFINRNSLRLPCSILARQDFCELRTSQAPSSAQKAEGDVDNGIGGSADNLQRHKITLRHGGMSSANLSSRPLKKDARDMFIPSSTTSSRQSSAVVWRRQCHSIFERWRVHKTAHRSDGTRLRGRRLDNTAPRAMGRLVF